MLFYSVTIRSIAYLQKLAIMPSRLLQSRVRRFLRGGGLESRYMHGAARRGSHQVLCQPRRSESGAEGKSKKGPECICRGDADKV